MFKLPNVLLDFINWKLRENNTGLRIIQADIDDTGFLTAHVGLQKSIVDTELTLTAQVVSDEGTMTLKRFKIESSVKGLQGMIDEYGEKFLVKAAGWLEPWGIKIEVENGHQSQTT